MLVPRIRLTVALAFAGLLVTPGVAGAMITTTHVETPAPDALILNDISNGVTWSGRSELITISGRAPGATDGDDIKLICTHERGGVLVNEWSSYVQMGVQDERFSTVLSPPRESCTLRAVPDDLWFRQFEPLDTDLSRFTGPRVLAGELRHQDLGVNQREYEGAHQYFEHRGQAHGGFTRSGLWGGPFGPYSTGGVVEAGVAVGTLRRPVLGPSGGLLGFGGYDRPATDEDGAAAGLTVDGAPAAPVPVLGAARAVVTSRALDRPSGDLTSSERAPIGTLPRTPYDRATFDPGPSGVELSRTMVQDHAGRQLRIADTFRSVDGRPHRIVARYAASGGAWSVGAMETPEFRMPWTTGDRFVALEPGTIAPAPPGGTTIDVRGARTRWGWGDVSSPLGDPERAYAAITYASAPSELVVLSSAALAARFERVIPPNGSVTLRHSYTQDTTPEGVAALVATLPADPLPELPKPPPSDPRVGDPPGQPAPAPAPPPRSTAAKSRLGTVATAVRHALRGKPGRQLRAGRPVKVAIAGMPRGRYAVELRPRGSRTVLVRGTRTIASDGRVVLQLRPTAAGKRYLRRATVRRKRSVPVAIHVSWRTPEGALHRRSGTGAWTAR